MQLDTLVGNVLIQAPGCSDMLAIDALRKAAIQICERTNAWRETVTQSTSSQEVDIDVPAHGRAISIQRVFADGELISPITPEQADPFEEAGAPRGYYRISDNVIALFPAPDVSVSLTIDACYAPTSTAVTIPDDLGERCRMAIIWGALAYLLAIPGQAWTQPALAGAYTQMFDSAVDKIGFQDARGRVRATVRTRASFF